jgi:hypothetical protein
MLENLVFLGVAVVCTACAVYIVPIAWRPFRKEPHEDWLDWWLRIFLAPGNAIFFAAIAWLALFGIEYEGDFSPGWAALGTLWVLFLTGGMNGIDNRRRRIRSSPPQADE